jgi:hypothetical protein
MRCSSRNHCIVTKMSVPLLLCLYSEAPGFKSRLGDWLSWLRLSVVFLSAPGECRGSTSKLGHDRFLPNPFQFTNLMWIVTNLTVCTPLFQADEFPRVSRPFPMLYTVSYYEYKEQCYVLSAVSAFLFLCTSGDGRGHLEVQNIFYSQTHTMSIKMTVCALVTLFKWVGKLTTIFSHPACSYHWKSNIGKAYCNLPLGKLLII